MNTATTTLTPAVQRLLGKFADWLSSPHRVAVGIEADNLLAVLRIHARFMHGCRDLKIEAAALFAQVPYGDPADWNTRHRAYQDAEDLAGLAWSEAMIDADRAFLALTGIDPNTAAYVAAFGTSFPTADLLRDARAIRAVAA
ncbi:hypothetical protein [Streptomyces sp. NBC_00338]|uniref:hypothetical protein n=1 Tax=Streptomyces sp. NBC_00338 TaxID=2975715 RepID=UPI002259E6DE|nr:hypothetical protein [Streptomyces sp. NBC_00338]MCX5145125.1 hypothetical protein [Streptomyces sp. NBC_00338]